MLELHVKDQTKVVAVVIVWSNGVFINLVYFEVGFGFFFVGSFSEGGSKLSYLCCPDSWTAGLEFLVSCFFFYVDLQNAF